MVMFTFYVFSRKNPFLGKFGPENQNCQFKVNLDTKTSPNMQNSMVMFTFFCLRLEMPFLGKFGQKRQNYQFNLKLGGT